MDLRSASESRRLDIGCVHGRFQPFHNEHLEYVGRAYELCRVLYIGITHSVPCVGAITKAAPHRHTHEANPFSFTERMELILASLEDAGYDVTRVRVVPFPIESPSLIENYVPSRAVHLLSPCDEWQIEKYQSLLLAGFSVQWVIGSRKGIQASSVRSLLRRRLSVNRLVPPPVAQFLRDLEREPTRSPRTARALFHVRSV